VQYQKPVIRQEQRLKMTPQLYQAIKIMALPLQELRTSIQDELERNPALEMIEDNSLVSLDEKAGELKDDYDFFDNSSDPGYNFKKRNSTEDSKRNFIEGVLTRPESLHDHLLWQLRLQPISKENYRIGELLIRNLDDNGFHIEPPESLVKESELKILEEMKALINKFDPVGVCTRDYQEALLVQIENYAKALPGSYEVVEFHLKLLEKEKYKDIARAMHKSEEEIMEILEFIRKLDPLPGRNYSVEPVRHVIPDVMVILRDGEFVLIINDEEIPVLGIDPFYADFKEKKDQAGKKELRNFVQHSLQDARWFIRSIHQRNDTLLKVCRSIIEFQRGFFRKGPKYLIPLTLKNIAGEIGVHEATVSRVTNGKYVQTEWGIFELKYFFTNSVPGTGTAGRRFSKEGVKQIIKEIVEAEGKNKNLTDKMIMEILKKKGVNIARRTIAKYRKELDIMSSYSR
jgi:RNA polymerase sigma-54 factor